MGQGDKWMGLGYAEMKALLLKHFRGESTVHQRKLLSLKCTGDLAKFQEEFTSAAAAALPVMGEAWVKEQYLTAVQPAELAMFLRARAGESLQSLMSTALDLEADLKRSKNVPRNQGSASTTGVVERKQDPNREPCKKCKKWKFVWDNCSCGQLAHKKRLAGMGPRRVQQVTVNEAELHQYTEDDEGKVGCCEQVETAEADF